MNNIELLKWIKRELEKDKALESYYRFISFEENKKEGLNYEKEYKNNRKR